MQPGLTGQCEKNIWLVSFSQEIRQNKEKVGMSLTNCSDVINHFFKYKKTRPPALLANQTHQELKVKLPLTNCRIPTHGKFVPLSILQATPPPPHTHPPGGFKWVGWEGGGVSWAAPLESFGVVTPRFQKGYCWFWIEKTANNFETLQELMSFIEFETGICTNATSSHALSSITLFFFFF